MSNNRIEYLDDGYERLAQEGLAAIGRIDQEAKGYTGTLPEHIKEAICHSSATLPNVIAAKEITLFIRAFCALSQNLYKAGYVKGQEDTKAIFGVGQG